MLGVIDIDGVLLILGVRVTDTLGVIVKDGVIEILGVGLGIGKFPGSLKSV
jgi:hypothetical protein